MSTRVLIVDDEANMRWVLKEALAEAGYEVSGASTGHEALDQMGKTPADLVILDLKLKGMDGLATLRQLRERWPEVVVIMLTAHGTVATAVEAMQLGAADYLRKPFDVEEVTFKLQRALERRALQTEVARLRLAVSAAEHTALVGGDPAWQRCVEQVRSLTAFDLDILFLGEAGAGKTALARLAHAVSDRRTAPLVEIDMCVLPADLQSPLLVGAGSPEGAWSRAGAGTLVVRHVEQLGSAGWSALRERWSARDRRGPRLLLTALVPPQQEVVLAPQVHVPALRERLLDLPLLAEAFVPGMMLSPDALHILSRYPWPSNIAELRGVVMGAAVLAGDTVIEERHLSAHVTRAPALGAPVILPMEGLNLEAVEISLLQQALDLAAGNKTRAAELLGLTRHTLLYRLEKYGLPR